MADVNTIINKKKISKLKTQKYMVKAHSALIGDNPNLNCYPTLINIMTLNNNALPS